MVGVWSAAAEARRAGVSLHEVELMQEIERYNKVDCRVRFEVISWLRANR
jgi:predicted RecB family nuclease